MPVRKEWRLTRGGELLAVLRQDGRRRIPEHECPEAAAETMPAFEPLRPRFEREAELLDVDREPENSEWVDIWEALKAPGLFVESPDGRDRIDVLWIHFRDGRAWWYPLFASPQTVVHRS